MNKNCHRFLSLFSKSQKFGAVLLLVIVVIAYTQPIFYPKDIALQNLSQILNPPSAAHWLGTDQFGRDMLGRLAAAVRLSFGMAVGSVLVALFFGLSLGIVAGFGGILDKLLSLICDVVMALPGLLFILLFAAIAPNSFWALYLGIALVMWVEFFRVSRAISQTLAQSGELESSRLLGMGLFYCVRRHFLPKLLPLLLPLAAFSAANAILALATLGFINVGLRPPTAELGLMMTELFPHYYTAPWIFIQPIIVVMGLVLGLQLLSGQEK